MIQFPKLIAERVDQEVECGKYRGMFLPRKKVQLVSLSYSSGNWLPYPAAVLISRCRQEPNIQKSYQFVSPAYQTKILNDSSFLEQLRVIDIFGLSNWIWNQCLNDRLSKKYKEINPRGIVLYGGPNVPENEELAEKYRSQRLFVDYFFFGPAEESFVEFLKKLGTSQEPKVPGTFSRDEFNSLNLKSRHSQNKINYPYVDGTLEEFFRSEKNNSLIATLETNRGCPYGCSFCDWGGVTRNRIIKSIPAKTQDSIQFLMKQKQISEICIADANFGFFAEDLSYTKLLSRLKYERTEPLSVGLCGFAKNGSPYLEEIISMFDKNLHNRHNNTVSKVSFQSHDPEVLKRAHRENIKTNKLQSLVANLSKNKKPVQAEMIIGLLGETTRSWLDSIQKNVDLRVKNQLSFPLLVLPNTPLSQSSYRKKYEIVTKQIRITDQLMNIDLKGYQKLREAKKLKAKLDYSHDEFHSYEVVTQCYSYDPDGLINHR